MHSKAPLSSVSICQGIQGKCIAQRLYLSPCFFQQCFVFRIVQDFSHEPSDDLHLLGHHPPAGDIGGADANAAGHMRAAGFIRDRIFVDGDAGTPQRDPRRPCR
jgi:hypothetical protein